MCPSARISQKPSCWNFKHSVHVASGYGLILLWRQCSALCTSGFVSDITFPHHQGAAREWGLTSTVARWDSNLIDSTDGLVGWLFHHVTLKTRYAQRAQTFADPEDPDFRLWTPRSEAWSGSPPKLYHLVHESCPTPPKNFVKIRSHFLRVIRRTDRQTDRTENTTSFFGGGNDIIKISIQYGILPRYVQKQIYNIFSEHTACIDASAAAAARRTRPQVTPVLRAVLLIYVLC